MAKNKSIEYNRYKCLVCADEPEFEHEGIMKHLQNIHGITPEVTKGVRDVLMHADGANFFIWRYRWTLDGGIKFEQETCRRR